eukprot:scaffold608535_cov59-Attheya_sp.AAC.2
MDQFPPELVGQGRGMLIGLTPLGAVNHDVGSVSSQPLSNEGGSRFWHHHGGGYGQRSARMRRGQSGIAPRRTDETTGTRRHCLLTRVPNSPQFEGPRGLQRVQLEVYRAPSTQFRQWIRPNQGRLHMQRCHGALKHARVHLSPTIIIDIDIALS